MTEAERHKAQADIVFQMRLTEAMAPLRLQLAAYKAALAAWEDFWDHFHKTPDGLGEGPWDCPQIERLLNDIRARVQAALAPEVKPMQPNPKFCHHPEKCRGLGACPREYACND